MAADRTVNLGHFRKACKGGEPDGRRRAVNRHPGKARPFASPSIISKSLQDRRVSVAAVTTRARSLVRKASVHIRGSEARLDEPAGSAPMPWGRSGGASGKPAGRVGATYRPTQKLDICRQSRPPIRDQTDRGHMKGRAASKSHANHDRVLNAIGQIPPCLSNGGVIWGCNAGRVWMILSAVRYSRLRVCGSLPGMVFRGYENRWRLICASPSGNESIVADEVRCFDRAVNDRRAS